MSEINQNNQNDQYTEQTTCTTENLTVLETGDCSTTLDLDQPVIDLADQPVIDSADKPAIDLGNESGVKSPDNLEEEFKKIITKCLNTNIKNEIWEVNTAVVRDPANVFLFVNPKNNLIKNKYKIIAHHFSKGRTYVMWQVFFGQGKCGYAVFYESRERAKKTKGPRGLQSEINILLKKYTEKSIERNNVSDKISEETKFYNSHYEKIKNQELVTINDANRAYNFYATLSKLNENLEFLNNEIAIVGNEIFQKNYNNTVEMIEGREKGKGVFLTTNFGNAVRKMKNLSGLEKLDMLNKKPTAV